MKFSDIIGYHQLKSELIHMAQLKRIPHNILFDQEDGMPGVALALAFFQYLNCENPNEDSCGTCRHCQMISQLAYPDLYCIYPVVNASGTTNPSELFFEQWQTLVLNKKGFFASHDWLEALNAENSRPFIYTGDANYIENKLSLHIAENGYRMVLIYQPERMREEMANKLLKLMEEPPDKTLFCSVAINSEQLLETIVSRMQRFELLPLTYNELVQGIKQQYPQLKDEETAYVAERSEGILSKAFELLSDDKSRAQYFEYYKRMVSFIYLNDVASLKILSEDIAKEGREKVVAILEYMISSFRNALRYAIDNTCAASMMNNNELNLMSKMTGWVTTQNINSIYNALHTASLHIKGNVLSKMVLFDAFLAISVALAPNLRAIRAKKAR